MADEWNVSFEEDQHLDVTFEHGGEFAVNFENGVTVGDYDGPYAVTPSAEEQTLNTANKMLASNIVVNPIPSNYGLISWDGVVITVS